jgi:hypothetical protein
VWVAFPRSLRIILESRLYMFVVKSGAVAGWEDGEASGQGAAPSEARWMCREGVSASVPVSVGRCGVGSRGRWRWVSEARKGLLGWRRRIGARSSSEAALYLRSKTCDGW